MESIMEFKDKLVLVRARLNLSQEGLAKELNVSFATINRWEKGHTIPQQRYVVALDELCKKSNLKIDG